MHEKVALRAEVMAWRKALQPEQVTQWSTAIAERVLALPRVQRAGRVVAYVGVRNEVHTEGLVRQLLAAGVEVAVPRVVGPGKMVAAPLSAWDALVPGKFRIPTSAAEAWPELPEVVLVPGVAFDHQRYRLGYGGGFYDRFVTDAQYAVALCFEGQLRDAVPVEPHDRMMDVVVTEAQVIGG